MRYISLFFVLGGPSGSWPPGNVAYLTPHLLSVGVDPIRVALCRAVGVNIFFIQIIWIWIKRTDWLKMFVITLILYRSDTYTASNCDVIVICDSVFNTFSRNDFIIKNWIFYYLIEQMKYKRDANLQPNTRRFYAHLQTVYSRD